MKGLVPLAIIGAMACAGLVGAWTSRTLAHADDDQSVLEADHALIQLLGKGDKASLNDHLALAELLDEDFTWIDSNGKSLIKSQILKNFPTPANTDVELQKRTYGRSGFVRVNRGNVQVLRVWAKRASGWRVVLYQEVTMAAKSDPPPAAEAGSNECENPCKTIPFQPETPSEREAIVSWQGVMQAMSNNDADAYAPLIADEFTATDTHHDRSYTKADRLSQIKKQRLAGARSVPPALVSARMFDFGETVMMIAREQRANAKAYFNTRMWVKREGRWQMLFSFNTRIE
jgi:uncharacterized protein DUF4440